MICKTTLLCLFCTFALSCTTTKPVQKRLPLSLTPQQRYEKLFEQPVSGYVVLHRNILKYTTLEGAKKAIKKPQRIKKPKYVRALGSFNHVLHMVIKDHGDVVEVRHLDLPARKKHCTKGVYGRHSSYFVNGFVPKRALSPVLGNKLSHPSPDKTSYTFQRGVPVALAQSPKRQMDFVAHFKNIQMPILVEIEQLALSYTSPELFSFVRPHYNSQTKKYEPVMPRIHQSKQLTIDGFPIWAPPKYDYMPYPLSVIQSSQPHEGKDLLTLKDDCMELIVMRDTPKKKIMNNVLGVLRGGMGIGGIGLRGRGNASKPYHYLPKNTPMYWAGRPDITVTKSRYLKKIKEPFPSGVCFQTNLGFGKRRLCAKPEYYRLQCKYSTECKTEQKCTPDEQHKTCVKSQ